MSDTSSSPDIWTTYPDVVCYAYDAYPRRLALFTGAAAFHPAAKRWLPVGDSRRIDGPLEANTPDAASGGLTIKPGHEAAIQEQLASAPKFAAGIGAPGDGSRRDQPTIVGQH
jgi:hypothetical protein